MQMVLKCGIKRTVKTSSTALLLFNSQKTVDTLLWIFYFLPASGEIGQQSRIARITGLLSLTQMAIKKCGIRHMAERKLTGSGSAKNKRQMAAIYRWWYV